MLTGQIFFYNRIMPSFSHLLRHVAWCWFASDSKIQVSWKLETLLLNRSFFNNKFLSDTTMKRGNLARRGAVFIFKDIGAR